MVVSAVAIVVALNGVRDQLRLSVFLTYTERYAKAMSGVPFEARRPGGRYELSTQSVEERERVLGAFREYLNLCSEELWLHDRHKIDKATWCIWESGMQQVACFPPFREAWEYLAPEYEYYTRFQRFVAERLLQRSPGEVPQGTDTPSALRRGSEMPGPLGQSAR